MRTNTLEQDIYSISLATIRAIARDDSLKLIVGKVPIHKTSGAVFVTQLPDPTDKKAVSCFRALRDAPALRRRYSNPVVERRYAPEQPVALLIYSELEQARCEALGLRELEGVAMDLVDQLLQSQASPPALAVVGSTTQRLAQAIAYLARCHFFNIAAEPPLAGDLVKQYALAAERFLEQLPELASALSDQEQFAPAAARIARLFLGQEAHTKQQDTAQDRNERKEKDAQHRQSSTEERSNYKQLMRVWQTASPRMVSHANDPAIDFEYRVFTRRYDQALDADELPSVIDRERYQELLDTELKKRPISMARAAGRLQRYLQARQQRDWQFDQEEGLLDPRRLTRLVTRPEDASIFKQELEAPYPDTVVSMLVDNSGSMRNRPILTAAASAVILGQLLERCGVKSEVLGFTTRDWRGGKSRQDWIKAGRPDNPGRINALRHIVYKNANDSWRLGKPRLPLMLDPNLLKENIDGEALDWAAQRLAQRSEQRRILIIVSDGAPLDDATLRANDYDYLDHHLRQVIARIEGAGAIEMLAIGIGHDVTGYYRRAITLDSADQLTETILIQLFKLLQDLDKRG